MTMMRANTPQKNTQTHTFPHTRRQALRMGLRDLKRPNPRYVAKRPQEALHDLNCERSVVKRALQAYRGHIQRF